MGIAISINELDPTSEEIVTILSVVTIMVVGLFCLEMDAGLKTALLRIFIHFPNSISVQAFQLTMPNKNLTFTNLKIN